MTPATRNQLTTAAVLQTADIASTLLFLGAGVTEGSPLYSAAIHAYGPVAGLAAAKAGIIIPLTTAAFIRPEALKTVNTAYAYVVGWNICAIWMHYSPTGLLPLAALATSIGWKFQKHVRGYLEARRNKRILLKRLCEVTQ